MDATRFAELVHSLQEAGPVARGRARPGDIEALWGPAGGFFEGDGAKTGVVVAVANLVHGGSSRQRMDRTGAARGVVG